MRCCACYWHVLDRNTVIAGSDVRIRQQYILRLARIETIGILGGFRGEAGGVRIDIRRAAGRAVVAGPRVDQAGRKNFDAPRRQANHVIGGHMEIRRVFQSDVVQREVSAVVDLQQPRDVLAQAFSDVEIGQIPPTGGAGVWPGSQRAAAASIDLARTNDRAFCGIGDVDERLA